MYPITASENASFAAPIKKVDDGFEIFESVILPAECERIIEALPSGKPGKRAGQRHLLSCPFFMDLAYDPRLLCIARTFVGRSAIPFRATLFEKSGYANWLVMWHQDTAVPLTRRFESPNWGPWSIKDDINYAHAPAHVLERTVALRLHLDPSTEANGPLRVVPGSHVLGLLNDDEVLAVAHGEPTTTCLLSRGGILAMRPLLIHASSKALTERPRRVLHIEYVDQLDIGDGIELVQV